MLQRAQNESGAASQHGGPGFWVGHAQLVDSQAIHNRRAGFHTAGSALMRSTLALQIDAGATAGNVISGGDNLADGALY